MKKTLLSALLFIACLPMFAQLNVQMHYDLGKAIYGDELSNRPLFTATVENFKADKWGSTFFFIDLDFGDNTMKSVYAEFSREFKLGKSPFAAHVEYNGGLSGFGSYNDAYDVLSLLVADSKEDFLTQVTQRAQELGATQSSFLDVCGVKDNSQTTAADLLKIALAAYKNEMYMQLTSTLRYKLSDGTTIKNRNELISSNTYYNANCKGMSAGSTARAGNCIITTVDNGKEVYLCIVLGGKDGENENNLGYETVNRLVKWVYATYSYIEVITPETPICTIPVTVSDLTSEIEVRTNTSLSCYLPAGLELGKDITYSIRLIHTSLEAPVSEGMMVGYVAILWNGKTLGTVPLYTAGSAQRSSFVSSLKRIQALTEGRIFRAGAVFFTVTFTGWIITEYIIFRRRRHRWDKYFSEKISPPLDEKRQK